MTELTRELVREHLQYNLNTGVFIRLISNSHKSPVGSIAGRYDVRGYIVICVNGTDYKAHRLAFLYVLGWMPDQVDHINHIRDDNRWINLRPASSLINRRNRTLQYNNKSGANGVCWHKGTGKWRARIVLNNKGIHLGLFEYKHDAIKARQKANKKYGFHPNHGKTV